MAGTNSLAVESPYVRRARRPGSVHRLFCFPHAGAGAGAFAGWPAALPAEVELVAVQLPGREDRSRERPFAEAEPLVRNLAAALRPYLRGRFSFFGHSGGALLGFELARTLHAAGRPGPAHLLVSGQNAPDEPGPAAPVHDLPDAPFRTAVTEIGGTSADLMADDDLMAVLMPALRADFRLWETWSFRPAPPLPGPVVALAGRDDPRVTAAGLDGWRRQTTGEFRVERFEGGHFYLDGPDPTVPATIGALVLGQVAGARA